MLFRSKITVEFDEAGGTWKALGKYGAWFESAVGIHTRDICEPFHDAWKDVSDIDKRTIQDRMLVFFYGTFCIVYTIVNNAF